MTTLNSALICSITSSLQHLIQVQSIKPTHEVRWAPLACIAAAYSAALLFMISVRRVVTSSPHVLIKCSKSSQNISLRAEANCPSFYSTTTSWTGAETFFKRMHVAVIGSRLYPFLHVVGLFQPTILENVGIYDMRNRKCIRAISCRRHLN